MDSVPSREYGSIGWSVIKVVIMKMYFTDFPQDGALGTQRTHGRDKTVAHAKTDSTRGDRHRRVAGSSRLVSRKYLPAEGGA